MISLTQILLVIVITVLTGLLVVIGIQVVNILKEVRLSLQKMNQMILYLKECHKIQKRNQVIDVWSNR